MLTCMVPICHPGMSRVLILLPLCLTQGMSAIAACLLYSPVWKIEVSVLGGAGVENLNWAVTCLDLSETDIPVGCVLWALPSLQQAWTLGSVLLLLWFF